MHKLVQQLVWDQNELMQPFKVDQFVEDGEELPFAGGLKAVHVPCRDAGRLVFLWQGNRLLIAGDAFMNIFGLAGPIGFEDEAEGRRLPC